MSDELLIDRFGKRYHVDDWKVGFTVEIEIDGVTGVKKEDYIVAGGAGGKKHWKYVGPPRTLRDL